MTVNPNNVTIANDNSREITYLGGVIGAADTISLFYGTRGSDGLPDSIAQSLTFPGDPGRGTRVFYDAQGLPYLARHEENGAFLTFLWQADRVVIKLYQPDGSYVAGGTVVAGGSAGFTAAKLPDSAVVGTFIGQLSGLQDGVISITIGGTAAGTASRCGSGRRVGLTRGRTSRTAALDALKPTVERLNQLSVGATVQAFASSFLASLAASADGANALLPSLLTAIAGAAPTPPFIGTGKPMTTGLAALVSLSSASGTLLRRIGASEDVIRTGDLFTGTESPVDNGYVASGALIAPSGRSDSTRVQGIASCRELGSIPLSGVIDAQNNLAISGNAPNGAWIQLTGQVSGARVAGHWTTGQSRGRSEGTWDGDQHTLGQCSEQENSGGQGIFTNTYDLGQTCGSFTFRYEAYTIPDQFEIIYEGQELANTGSVSGGTTLTLDFVGSSSIITVIVTANLDGTLWNYTVGCPH